MSAGGVLVTASLILTVAALASRLLGWIRLLVIGSQFGASRELDAYFAAFRIPDAIFQLVVAGALSAALIPVFSSYRAARTGRRGVAAGQQRHQPRPHRARRPEPADGDLRARPRADRGARLRCADHRADDPHDARHAGQPGAHRDGRGGVRHPEQLSAVHGARHRAAALQPRDHRRRHLPGADHGRRGPRRRRRHRLAGAPGGPAAEPGAGRAALRPDDRPLAPRRATGRLADGAAHAWPGGRTDQLPGQHRPRLRPAGGQPDRVQLRLPAVPDPGRRHRREHRGGALPDAERGCRAGAHRRDPAPGGGRGPRARLRRRAADRDHDRAARAAHLRLLPVRPVQPVGHRPDGEHAALLRHRAGRAYRGARADACLLRHAGHPDARRLGDRRGRHQRAR